MNVLITVEQHFDRTADGRVWTDGQFSYPFWGRYLSVFESVYVFARVRQCRNLPPGRQPADGPGVFFCDAPDYLGPQQYLLRAREVAAAASEAIKNADAVILRVPGQMGRAIERQLHRLGRPYAVEVVSDPYDVFAPHAIKHPLRPLFRHWFSRRLRNVCANACGAAYVTEFALQNRYPPGKEAFATYYSDVELPGAAFVDKPRDPLETGGVVRLLFVGSLAQLLKAPDVLIDAVGACVHEGLNLELVFVGSGQYQAELKLRAEALGLGNRVQFRGQLTTAEAIRAELDQADLFVLPSRHEGLPRALIEAMARALPCIGSTVGGFPELLQKEDLVPPGDSQALARKIREVLEDPSRLVRMSARNLERARRYTPELLFQRRDAYYHQVRRHTEEWLDGKKNVAAMIGGRTKSAGIPAGSHSIRADGAPAPMRLLLVLPNIVSYTAFLSEVGADLIRDGAEVHLACSRDALWGTVSEHGIANIHLHSLTIPRGMDLAGHLKAARELNQLVSRIQPDIVHAHFSTTIFTTALARRSGWPVTLGTFHGVSFPLVGGMKGRLLRFAECWAASRLDTLWVLTEDDRRRLTDTVQGVDVRLPRSLGIGCDLQRFNRELISPAQRSDLRSSLGIQPDACVFIFVGRFLAFKGFDVTIRAFLQMAGSDPDWRLLLVGAHDPLHASGLTHEEEKAWKDCPRIVDAGYQQDVRPYLAISDVMVFPSQREGMPVCVMEALAMGVPVITRDSRGCRDLVQNGHDGLVLTRCNPLTLAVAMRDLAQNAPLRRRLAEEALAGRHRFDRREFVRDQIDAYRELLERRSKINNKLVSHRENIAETKNSPV